MQLIKHPRLTSHWRWPDRQRTALTSRPSNHAGFRLLLRVADASAPTISVEHRGLYLLKRAGVDLPNAFARYSIFCRKIIKVRRRLGQMTSREDMPLTGVKRLKGDTQGLSPSDHFMVVGHRNVMAGRRINE